MEPTIIIIFILIYLLTILLSATEVVSMSIAALSGALLTAWFGLQYGVFNYEEAVGFIDVRLLGLIMGTMIVVEVAEKSGLFRFGALYAVKLSKGNPGRLFVSICIISAVVSMFLSDPTAMLLMAAATVTISKLLNYDPIPYFLSATIMINLGGTSTLIGSTSNMVIGVASEMTFTDFISYLLMCEVALWALTIFALYMLFKPRLGKKKALPEYNPWQSIENKKLFYQSIFTLVLLVFLFLILGNLGVGPEAVALGCAILALVLSNSDPAQIFKGLDWETLVFIAGFMFIVGGIQKTEILNVMSEQLFLLVGGSPLNTTLTTLWFSGLASAVVSNVAIALTFVPIIAKFSALNPTLRPPVSSALVLGTNLGGATTPLSGSVCMMAIGALKREGISMSFSEFTKIGLITSILQLGVSSLYLIWRFTLLGG
ncbi:MAG: SLC13 family permease [Candidatus Bathyarchaeota archaeon]|nr:SLC13 family permease [Candidatus Bathyarchaeota archaeon]MDH5494858.1 SLC13 family permease [Candidatus Bathyarchaeota archaeon]